MNNCTLEELQEVYAFLDAVGLPKNKGYEEYVKDWIDKGMSVSEALTQTCDGAGEPCSSRIIHQNAKWRFQLGAIRCPECQKKAVKLGYTPWEAAYVV